MANPSPTVSIAGQGAVTADLLNTYVQGGGMLLANLQAFSGLTGMTVIMSGSTAIADGGQGVFSWNSTWTGTPDNVNSIQPSGVTQGAWVRIGYLTTLQFTFTAVVVTTGFSQTPSASVGRLILTPAGTLATGSVTMPASPYNGQVFSIASTQTVTALTMNPNAGQTLVGGLTTIAANGFGSWQWVAAASTWYRVG